MAEIIPFPNERRKHTPQPSAAHGESFPVVAANSERPNEQGLLPEETLRLRDVGRDNFGTYGFSIASTEALDDDPHSHLRITNALNDILKVLGAEFDTQRIKNLGGVQLFLGNSQLTLEYNVNAEGWELHVPNNVPGKDLASTICKLIMNGPRPPLRH